MSSQAAAHRDRVETFYAAFAAHDGDAMAACYRPDGRFRDPAFGELTGAQAGDMWRMLTARADDLEVELVECDAGDDTATARWIARYTLTQTGRFVVNDVRAEFRFGDDGRFAEHVDRFSFHGWASQAMGPLGTALGWTPLLPALVRRRARGQLEAFSTRRPG